FLPFLLLCMSLSPLPFSSLSLHDALPILVYILMLVTVLLTDRAIFHYHRIVPQIFHVMCRNEVLLHTNGIDVISHVMYEYYLKEDRKSTRLNSSHVSISYAVFCLKKKKTP